MALIEFRDSEGKIQYVIDDNNKMWQVVNGKLVEIPPAEEIKDNGQ